ncbi:MAG: hypothetical protein ACL7BU_04285 [Candidatus Phlomobacter fragariae]
MSHVDLFVMWRFIAVNIAHHNTVNDIGGGRHRLNPAIWINGHKNAVFNIRISLVFLAPPTLSLELDAR